MVVAVPRGTRFTISLTLATAAALAMTTRAGTVSFVMSERPGLAEHHDSFVLPLSRDEDIAHARDLISLGPDAAGSPIVFAEVAAGADGMNRNVPAAGKRLWSWHVSRFEGFGDAGIELLDGSPTMLEADVPGWIANTRRSASEEVGHIGFWNYTVTAELPAAPSVPIPAPLATGVIGLVAIGAARWWPGTPWRND